MDHDHPKHTAHGGHKPRSQDHHSHHAHMVADFKRRFWVCLVLTVPVLVRSDPRDVTAIVELAGATYRKMVQNLWWATGYNAFAIPLAAGVFYQAGIVLSPAAGAGLMSLSTVIVAINARLLRVNRNDQT